MNTFPPPPINETPNKLPRTWHLWYDRLSKFLSDPTGLIPWTSLNKSGAKLADIPDRFHNILQAIQGGAADQAYHLTAAEYTDLQRNDNVASVSDNTTLDDTYRTVFVSASGKTITLPAATAARIGHDWTVILGVDGYTDVSRAGSDTLTLPEVSSTIRLDQKGTSVTLRCLTATSWGIA